MLQYRINRPNQQSNLSNSIDGFTNDSYKSRPIVTGRRLINDSDQANQATSIKNDNIVSEASVFAKNLFNSDNSEINIDISQPDVSIEQINAAPFGLESISKIEQVNNAEQSSDTISSAVKVKPNSKLIFKLFTKLPKRRISIKNLFKPPWSKLKNWEEFKIFTAGATLAAGLIVLGFYLGFNRPLGLAESQNPGNSSQEASEILAEDLVKEKPIVKETSDGQKVEVSPGINPNEVDRRPPAPVDPSLPVRMKIRSININAPIRSVGLLPDKSLAVPNYVYQVGWYDQSTRPGEPGTMLVDGHYGVAGAWGVFSRLKEVSSGTEIEVLRGDGQTITYIVEEKASYDKNSVPMNKAFARDDKQRLSIITCDGTYLPRENTYTNRLIVYAVRK